MHEGLSKFRPVAGSRRNKLSMKNGERPFLSLAQRVRVPAGFFIAPVVLLMAKPSWLSIAWGGCVAAIGLGIRAWASGYLRKNEELATSGPYGYTRNPLYFGTFLLGSGVAINSGSVWVVVVFAALYLLIYVPVMIAEAEGLRALFPAEYDAYSRSVPLFAPRITPYRGVAAGRRFDGSLYLRHREYRAAAGLVVVLALLAVKMYLGI